MLNNESYLRYLAIDLLTRGTKTLSPNHFHSLKRALACDDIPTISNILSSYELRPKGIDTRSTLTSLLSSLNLSLHGNVSTHYTISSSNSSNPYSFLVGEYTYLSNVGDSLRSIDRFPGCLSIEFVSLYSWGKCKSNTSVSCLPSNFISSNNYLSTRTNKPPSNNTLLKSSNSNLNSTLNSNLNSSSNPLMKEKSNKNNKKKESIVLI